MNGYSIPDLLKLLLRRHGECLWLEAGLAPTLRIKGQEYEVQGPVLERDAGEELLRSIASTREMRVFREHGCVDFLYLFGNTRFAVDVSRPFGGFRIEVRLLNSAL